ncbi:MAG: cysteine desulfurase family protein [Clostridia bacterium]|nr:cysteine desulfurase family protein [Clostridia bacterium]
MIYFDNSATTAVCREAADKAYYMMTECWGNPSSLHKVGFEAEKELNRARDIIADKLGCDSSEVYFTSGGTEADNLAIFGGADARKRRGNRVVTTAIEHSAVLAACRQLEKMGYKVIYLKPDDSGQIPDADIYNAITKDTILVSMMSVNNETGLMLPLQTVSNAIKRSGAPALFHVDNVQGFGKTKINIKKLGIDLMSISAHKIHGPKGVGALFMAKKARINPRTFGGLQEKQIRPGTEPIPAVCAFGEAVRVLPDEREELETITAIRDKLRTALCEMPDIVMNSREDAFPYILNFSCGKVRSETMLHFLSERGISVSSGSACSKSKPSHVLEAMGFNHDRIDSSIRVSFSRYNTLEEVDEFVKVLREGLDNLQQRK